MARTYNSRRLVRKQGCTAEDLNSRAAWTHRPAYIFVTSCKPVQLHNYRCQKTRFVNMLAYLGTRNQESGRFYWQTQQITTWYSNISGAEVVSNASQTTDFVKEEHRVTSEPVCSNGSTVGAVLINNHGVSTNCPRFNLVAHESIIKDDCSPRSGQGWITMVFWHSKETIQLEDEILEQICHFNYLRRSIPLDHNKDTSETFCKKTSKETQQSFIRTLKFRSHFTVQKQ